MNKNKIGLALGCLFAAFHLIWGLGVWLIPDSVQSLLNGIFTMHGLSPVYTIIGMTFMNLLLLVIMTFIAGYILGWVFAYFHDWIHKK